MDEIETINDQLVGVRGDGKVTVLAPKQVMTKDEALRHAAWLVVLADNSDDESEFAKVLNAIKNC